MPCIKASIVLAYFGLRFSKTVVIVLAVGRPRFMATAVFRKRYHDWHQTTFPRIRKK